jgi:hypothetical protein
MYRQGLGDSFLIRLSKPDGTPFHILIDCGVLIGSPDGPARVKRVVENIRQQTGGVIDLLVATHEHTDHLSGFNSERDAWAAMEIRKTWMAWTENLDRQEIDALKSSQRLRLRAALAGATRLEDATVSMADAMQRSKLLGVADSIRNVLQFSLDEDDDPNELLLAGADARPSGPARALRFLKDKAGSSIEYCHPKDAPRELSGVNGIRVFTLGPPDGPLLRHSDPAPGEAYELFGELANNDLNFAVATLLHETEARSDVLSDRENPDDPESQIFGASPASAQPFDVGFRHPADQVAMSRGQYGFFHDHYGFEDGSPDAWRRIDHDWLNVSESMALALTGHINNTSLALAFELGEGGPVLLFPGDAQSGSWLSWGDLKWTVPTAHGTRTVTGPDLLQRTVFYKVGHHGSHNATMRDKGLELMTHPDLVAFIPVHQKTAHKQVPPWRMPWPPLWSRLKERAAYRVMLSDADEPIASQLGRADLPSDAAFIGKWERFKAMLSWDKSPNVLWVDYELPIVKS